MRLKLHMTAVRVQYMQQPCVLEQDYAPLVRRAYLSEDRSLSRHVASLPVDAESTSRDYSRVRAGNARSTISTSRSFGA